MGTIECSQPASKSSWDSQDFGDISMVLKMAYFRKSTGPRWVKPGVRWASLPSKQGKSHYFTWHEMRLQVNNLNLLVHYRCHGKDTSVMFTWYLMKKQLQVPETYTIAIQKYKWPFRMCRLGMLCTTTTFYIRNLPSTILLSKVSDRYRCPETRNNPFII